MPPLRCTLNNLFFPCCSLVQMNEKKWQKKQHEFREWMALIHRKQKEKQQWLQVEQQHARTTCTPVHHLRATNQDPFCSLQMKRSNKTNNNNFVRINTTRTTSSCKTQVSWCLLVPQIERTHKAQLNKDALVLLLHCRRCLCFAFFGGIFAARWHSPWGILQPGGIGERFSFSKSIAQDTHYREILPFSHTFHACLTFEKLFYHGLVR